MRRLSLTLTVLAAAAALLTSGARRTQAERSAKAPNVTAVHAFRRIIRLLEVVELGIGREIEALGYGPVTAASSLVR